MRCANHRKEIDIEAYRQAVFRMLECVSPICTTEQFHDAVNEVIIKRKALGEDLDDLKINWNKYEKGKSQKRDA